MTVIKIAKAETAVSGSVVIGAKLDDEAGISAYFQSSDPINLSQVRSLFRTIETETTDYIIGSVPVPNHLADFDAHVYVNKVGWVLAYYLNSDPISKIIDVKAQTISSTKLKTVVSAVASAGGALFTDVTYYDFRYPNATNMMFVAKTPTNGSTFTIQMPSSYGYYYRGWASLGGCNNFTIDGVSAQSSAIWTGDYMSYGSLNASQMLPDITHALVVGTCGYGGAYSTLVIVYRIP